MADTGKNKAKTLGDVLIHEESPMYCRAIGTIKNGVAVAVTLAVGMPVIADSTNFELAVSTEEGSVTGILLDGAGDVIAASATSTKLYSVLVRGPAVINYDAIPQADQAAAAWDTDAELKARLLTLGILALSEPAVSSYQTN